MVRIRISEVVKRIKFWKSADRIGPDIPLTHWRLHFKSTMVTLCKSKFRHFGQGAEFRPGAYAVSCSNISLGDNVVIRPGTMLFASPTGKLEGGAIVIEDNVLLGAGIHFYTNYHKFSDPTIPIYFQGYDEVEQDGSIVIRHGSWIGANVILLRGVTIGNNSVVAAGSVVTKTVPPYVVVAGVPARVIRKLN